MAKPYTVFMNMSFVIEAEDEIEAMVEAKKKTIADGKIQSIQTMPGSHHGNHGA